MSLSPIAVVGMGCRVPGAETVDELWRLLLEGREAISEVPPEKWDGRKIARESGFPEDNEAMLWGGFLEQGDAFDPALFGINAREARRMDPQQALLLEVVWQALEHGGIAPSSLRLRNVGVYVGIGTCDFDRQLSRNRAALDTGAATGTSYSICSNRISYTFGLRGPSLTVDAACSSSLVAIHLACQSLWAGESEMALAGGAHLMLAPEKTLTLAAQGLLAPDGRCKSFSSRGNGYVRGEGAGMVVLMPWGRAIREGYRVFASIHGSAINHNGVSNGLSGPSGAAQQALIRSALARAGVSPNQISYVEAHGLGMRIGDEIELRALADVLREGRSAGEPLVVGSCKGNLGHLEAAAGVTSLLKAVMALRSGVIPKTLGADPADKNGPAVAGVCVATERQSWPGCSQRRHAGVTSLSFGGANAHVVLEGGSDLQRTSEERGEYRVLTFSAMSPSALAMYAQRYIEFLTTAANESRCFAEICFTAAIGRDHLPHRCALVARSCQEAAHALRRFTTDAVSSDLAFQGRVSRSQLSSACWVLGSEPTVQLQDAPEGIRTLYSQIGREAATADQASPASSADGSSARIALSTLLTKLLGAPAAILIEASSPQTSVARALQGEPVEVWRFGTHEDPIVDGCKLARTLARAHVAGQLVDWRAAFGPGTLASLPFYPFERARYWCTSELS